MSAVQLQLLTAHVPLISRYTAVLLPSFSVKHLQHKSSLKPVQVRQVRGTDTLLLLLLLGRFQLQ
jgi:hypothetical protein